MLLCNGTSKKKQEISNTQMSEDCWARICSWFREYNLQRVQSMQEGSTEEEEMKQQQRMKVMKDMTTKIRAKVRLCANTSWWVSELLAADCEKAWLHAGLEDTVQKWYDWLEEMKKKDEAQKVGRSAPKRRQSNDQECGRQCGAFAQDYQAHGMERRSAFLKKHEEDARSMGRCEEKRK